MDRKCNISRRNRRKRLAQAACLTIMIATSAMLLQNREEQRRQWWVRPWMDKKKGNLGITEEFLNIEDTKSFENYLRMDKDTFEKLLGMVAHRISKHSNKRECIPARTKLIITLRFLATGETYRSLMYNYRVSESSISLFVPIVCEAIYKELKDTYLKVPNTAAEWLNISKDFENMWNMPNVLGALDGKHIVIKAPSKEGSAYYNYKDQHSIVLLALVDANYNFLYINVGINGRVSDGGVYWESDLSRAVEHNLLNFPEDKSLPGRNMKVPYVIVADSAFVLSSRIMKPYSFKGITREQRIFNYRLSRARRVVENAFGILANRFRILLNTINLSPNKATIITQACCALHNFLKKELKQRYIGNFSEEESNENFKFLYGLRDPTGRRPKTEALKVRQEFTDYVNTNGKVSWQNDMF